jgi:hypothetical protein
MQYIQGLCQSRLSATDYAYELYQLNCQRRIATDGRSVSQSVSHSVLVWSPIRYLLLFDIHGLVFVGRPL